jgi:hypothetical protein
MRANFDRFSTYDAFWQEARGSYLAAQRRIRS